MINFLIVKYEMLCRMLFWGWNMRHSYDFDAQTLYDIIYLKLDRVYNCMLSDSHCAWNSSPDTKLMRRLYEARTLAKRLSEGDMYLNSSVKLTEKYRDIKPRGLLSSYLDQNSKPIESKLYSYILKKAFEKDNTRYQTDKQRLFMLLNKYLSEWWD